jgi:hypothetical protein
MVWQDLQKLTLDEVFLPKRYRLGVMDIRRGVAPQTIIVKGKCQH